MAPRSDPPDRRAPEGDGTELSPRRRWGALAAIVGLGVVADQATKQLADAHLRGREIVPVVEGFLDLRYARNPGAFFSMGASLEPTVRRLVFVLASAIAAVLITRLYAKAAAGQRALRWGLALLLSGALGNLIDRVLYGEVIDFVHMYWRGVFDWATYNVADVLLVAGVALLALDLLLPGRAANGSASGPEPTPSEADA